MLRLEGSVWSHKSWGTWFVRESVTIHQLLPFCNHSQARYACELVATRGVRVAKDITREWSDMSGQLIERLEAAEGEASRLAAACAAQVREFIRGMA
jgi:hypothetical protein